MTFPARPIATRQISFHPARRILAMALPALLLAGCAGTRPRAYAGIASTSHMHANPHSDRLPYAYATRVDWREYDNIVIEPVGIYDGPDAQFGKLSASDRAALADYMEDRFTTKLSERFAVVARPRLHTLRLRLTLTGARSTTAVAGSVSRIDLAGGPYNLVQAMRGKEGSLTGSVFYAIEIYDATTNRLLMAQIVKQYPAALNIKATFGALTAAKTGIAKGADELARQLGGSAAVPVHAGVENAIYDPDAAFPAAALSRSSSYPPCGANRVDGCRQRDAR